MLLTTLDSCPESCWLAATAAPASATPMRCSITRYASAPYVSAVTSEDAPDEEQAARESDRRSGDSHHPPHCIHRATQKVLEFGCLEALQVDRDDPIEQDGVGVSLDDRREHRLLLVLDQAGRARDDAQS